MDDLFLCSAGTLRCLWSPSTKSPPSNLSMTIHTKHLGVASCRHNCPKQLPRKCRNKCRAFRSKRHATSRCWDAPQVSDSVSSQLLEVQTYFSKMMKKQKSKKTKKQKNMHCIKDGSLEEKSRVTSRKPRVHDLKHFGLLLNGFHRGFNLPLLPFCRTKCRPWNVAEDTQKAPKSHTKH